MKRYVSGPALKLLNQASVTPDEVDRRLDDLVRSKASAILRRSHEILQRVRQSTNIEVIQISRRSRYLLIEIEQQDAVGPLWQYRELAPRRCSFSCPGELPATLEVALHGQLLEALVRPATAIDNVRIEKVDGTGDGWLSVDVTPNWHLF